VRAGPGGVSKRITAGQAVQILEPITLADAVALRARRRVAHDLARIDAQMRYQRDQLLGECRIYRALVGIR
jgi:hypothetical protein